MKYSQKLIILLIILSMTLVLVTACTSQPPTCEEKYSEKYCQGNNLVVNHTFLKCTDKCVTEVEIVEQCEYGCENAKCYIPECETNQDCGTPYCTGEPNYCSEGNLWQNFILPKCINPGKSNAYCSFNTIFPNLVQECEYGCLLGTCLNKTEEEIDEDEDGYNQSIDCNDTNELINPGMQENCSTPYDDNCDGRINENCNTSDTTPPASITNLRPVKIQETSIQWNWTNPADSDFYQNIIFLYGKNIVNTSNSYYEDTG